MSNSKKHDRQGGTNQNAMLARRLARAGAGVIAALVVARRAHKIAAVAPDLRSPVLLAPSFINGFTRPLLKGAAKLVRGRIPDGVRVTTHRVPRDEGELTTRLLVFDREGATGVRPVLFWIHGGGYVLGTPEQDIAFIARLLTRFDIVVASVDYRLAPDHPFPTPLDDCHNALKWVAEHASELSVDQTRVVIGGQSAGGGLAAALVQRVKDEGPIVPVFQLLVYPMLDAETGTRQKDAATGRLLWTAASNRYGWRSYLGSDPTTGSYLKYAVPSSREDLQGLPPAWIGVGTLDLFYSEDCAYAERLGEAGVACQLHVVTGAYHGFDIICPSAKSTSCFNTSMFAALENAFGRPAGGQK